MNLGNIFNFVYNGEQKAQKLGVREKYDAIGNLRSHNGFCYGVAGRIAGQVGTSDG